MNVYGYISLLETICRRGRCHTRHSTATKVPQEIHHEAYPTSSNKKKILKRVVGMPRLGIQAISIEESGIFCTTRHYSTLPPENAFNTQEYIRTSTMHIVFVFDPCVTNLANICWRPTEVISMEGRP